MIKIIYSFCSSKKSFRFIKRTASVPFILKWVHLLELAAFYFDKIHFLSLIYMKKIQIIINISIHTKNILILQAFLCYFLLRLHY